MNTILGELKRRAEIRERRKRREERMERRGGRREEKRGEQTRQSHSTHTNRRIFTGIHCDLCHSRTWNDQSKGPRQQTHVFFVLHWNSDSTDHYFVTFWMIFYNDNLGLHIKISVRTCFVFSFTIQKLKQISRFKKTIIISPHMFYITAPFNNSTALNV